MTTLEILCKIVNELNERCFDESSVVGYPIRPFVLETCGESVRVTFLRTQVLGDDEINDGNDPDEKVWRKIIEDEAIELLTTLRTLTIRDESQDTGHWHEDKTDSETGTATLTLGSCCVCGQDGPTVRNLLNLPFKSPTPGHGWGCLVCKIPPDGALAVICDTCFQQESGLAFSKRLKWICTGYPGKEGRTPFEGFLQVYFGHNAALHQDQRPTN